ncbi:DUF423 domain-containing protein [Chondromyces apiculatus]|uniref:DUF423 domain-containing protein n=1 Tax=Chondromyces apiculatus DSM 436 TaxID=1192034 RepID=A0A017T692_9BACT|nr:DUF423 domain-containing protein [Chondromyces apiculatus]EYF04744.1 Hypothetical protein CAP_4220 [Chondromyces apiculatus DSM 436]
MERLFFMLAGIYGFLGVALGAFGAHGLKMRLEALPDAAQRMGWWETGSQYHLIHALALALAAYLAGRTGATTATVAGFCFAGGVLLFSGSLYVMTVTGIRALGAVTPLGGLFMLAGWVAVTITAMRLGVPG